MKGLIVHLGANYPAYLTDSIDQFFLTNESKILYVIVDTNFQELKGLSQQYSNLKIILTKTLKKSLNHNFFTLFNPYSYRKKRGIFWRYAIERFFIIEDFMLTTEETNIVHFEGDNLIYGNIDSCFINVSKLCIAIDSDTRCIASVVVIPTLKDIEKFCRFYNHTFTLLPKNDMVAFSKYWSKNKSDVITLPVIPPNYAKEKNTLINTLGEEAKSTQPYHENFEMFSYIFDAAAFGQYTGGVDPKNVTSSDNLIGFINEQAVFNPSELPIVWKSNSRQLLLPHIEYPKGKFYPLFNLHIHSKLLSIFRSDRKSVEY